MSELIVLKIGGSVCTEKEKGRFKVRTAVIRRIAREIKRAKRRKKFKLVLVHGAGPFGHMMVKKYGINKGVKTKKQVQGFVETHNSMERLKQRVVEEFLRQGLFVFPIQPSAVILQENKRIKEFDFRKIGKILRMEEKIIPLMHGDVVLDEGLGASVISGDRIANCLGKKLKAKRILFGTDVEGVLDGKGRVIRRIGNKNYSRIRREIFESEAVDVTGGMLGKIEEIKKFSKGIQVIVFNMNKKDNVYGLLQGRKGIGTSIKFK